jgi:hypothetical protein
VERARAQVGQCKVGLICALLGLFCLYIRPRLLDTAGSQCAIYQAQDCRTPVDAVVKMCVLRLFFLAWCTLTHAHTHIHTGVKANAHRAGKSLTRSGILRSRRASSSMPRYLLNAHNATQAGKRLGTDVRHRVAEQKHGPKEHPPVHHSIHVLVLGCIFSSFPSARQLVGPCGSLGAEHCARSRSTFQTAESQMQGRGARLAVLLSAVHHSARGYLPSRRPLPAAST